VSTQAILERERRYRRQVVIASIVPLLLLVAAAAIQASGGATSDLAPATLRSIDESSAPLIIGALIAGFGFLLLAVPLAYIFLAAHARSERMVKALLFLVVLGPVLFAAQGLLLAVGQADVAGQFVEQENGVGDIYTLATNLLEDNGLRNAALVASSIAVLAIIFGMVYVGLWGVRTGLLTRFHGTLGMALGASFILPPLTQITLPALLAWFMYFGLMLAGRTPKGRPPAWDVGEAVPPLGPGEEPRPVAASASGDVIDGDATEIPGVGENPNAARRDRAKKRKRKRRR
jgi:MFS family permease